MLEAATPKREKLVLPLSNEQKILGTLERIEALLLRLVPPQARVLSAGMGIDPDEVRDASPGDIIQVGPGKRKRR